MDTSFLCMFPGCLASFGHRVGPVVYLGQQRPFGLVPEGSPPGEMLVYWDIFSHYLRSKEVLVHYCTTVWAMCILDWR